MSRRGDGVILILTFAGDLHGLVVDAALAHKGVRVRRWLGGDFGPNHKASLSVGNSEALSFELSTDDWTISDEAVRTVWARRPVFPVPAENLLAEDRRHVLQENSFFVQGAWWALTARCRWVNPYASRRYVKSKPIQLKVARESGFAIPRTLFSNDSRKIRAFAAALGGRPVLYKPHRISEWQEDGERFLLHAALLPPVDELDDGELSACAGIYQEYIEKDFELRVHVMGGFCVAARINSQQVSGAEVDWRSARIADLNVEPYALSDDVAKRCVAVVRAFGLAFGIIDAIVTPDGSVVFLELNEMGQFLWVERANPDVRVLDHFCEFISCDAPHTYLGHLSLSPVPYERILSDGPLMARHEAESSRPAPDRTIEWIDVLV